MKEHIEKAIIRYTVQNFMSLRTILIVIPSIALSLSIIGLAIIHNGGVLDIQLGPNKRLRLEGVNQTPDNPNPSEVDGLE